jgi:methionine sulfoxide reductase heme-binding subunit
VYPWTDRTGRFSALKTAVFAGLFIPALWLVWRWQTGDLGPRPYTEAIHFTGDWAIRLLAITLAVTPLQRIFGWGRLALVRRQIGLAVLAYALLHVTLYIADQKFALWHVASEIALRIYLTIGFVAVVGLIALGVTSTDGSVRRLGRKWKLLHRAVYVIGALAVVHYFMQSKIDATQSALIMGFVVLALSYRLLKPAQIRSPVVLLVTAAAAALVTAGLEATWYGLATGVKPLAVLHANLLFPTVIRPAWWVLGTGVGISAAAWLRSISLRRPCMAVTSA